MVLIITILYPEFFLRSFDFWFKLFNFIFKKKKKLFIQVVNFGLDMGNFKFDYLNHNFTLFSIFFYKESEFMIDYSKEIFVFNFYLLLKKDIH